MKVGRYSPFPNIPEANVHSGFLNAWNKVSEKTKLSIALAESICKECQRVLFLGHSLGAAITTLASLDVAFSHTTSLPLQSITLGSPRVGNKKFSEYISLKIPNVIRWTHAADMIPHLPPMIIGYRHRLREVWENDGIYNNCSETDSEDKKCSDGVSFPISLSDHSIYGGFSLKDSPCFSFNGQLVIDDDLMWDLTH